MSVVPPVASEIADIAVDYSPGFLSPVCTRSPTSGSRNMQSYRFFDLRIERFCVNGFASPSLQARRAAGSTRDRHAVFIEAPFLARIL